MRLATGKSTGRKHYYPFGLTMSGISSKALDFGDPTNHKKFNSIEETRDLYLNQYDAFYRNLDPQIGRFLQIDPKLDSSYSWSPYTAMFDNPLKFIDPLGDSSKPQQAYIPPPKNGLPGFPDGGKGSYNPKSGRWRWKLPDGDILEWDKQHGDVERYDKSGKKHKGSYNPDTGEQVKDPVPGRTTPKANPALPDFNPWSQNPFLPNHPPLLSPIPLNKTTETAVKVGTAVTVGYIVLKILEVAATIATDGAAAPVLAL